ncbi:MAG: SO2930 family diheme c-type cytochrome [Ekhidna sp.]
MRILVFIWIATLISCSQPEKKQPEIQRVSLGVEEVSDYPKMLSEWGFFKMPMSDLIPNDARTFSYEINAALFSDYAHKARFIQLPASQKIGYHDSEALIFPENTVLIKNFFYPFNSQSPESGRRIMETRLLIHEKKGWKAIAYQWNEEQTDAKRVILGKKVPVEWKDTNGTLQRIDYSIPSQPQCKSCHDLGGKMTPIGPTARQLNKGGQLTHWVEKGWLDVEADATFPKLVDYSNENEELDARARAWLEVNCAHCHRREGPAKNSGLYLLASQADPYRLGVNKPPIAAGKGSGGLKYSIVPGNPKQSILVHRIASLEPGEMMPELGRKMTHKEGVELISAWITSME